MSNTQDQIDRLQKKLELLLSKQEGFAKELMELYKEIEFLKKSNAPNVSSEDISQTTGEGKTTPIKSTSIPKEAVITEEVKTNHEDEIKRKKVAPSTLKVPEVKSNLEKFIGENLINKIGIIITVIGVAIGAKYSIENELISPLTRIILGYLTGIGLLGFGIRLKEKYENYSAVLVSGAMAIMYFITFSAYSFYALFPQTLAFVLMVIFTTFTVIAALHYNKQIIAHIGLVGAYAIPFFLSDGSGQAIILFSYMAIINIGILIISFKKYWKPLYYVAFVLTWLIYFSWYALSYHQEDHFSMAFVFLGLFFFIFYTTFIVYKLNKKEAFGTSDIVLLLCNAFIFYGIGYTMLSNHDSGKQLLGVFTLGNALIHFICSTLIFKQKLTDKSLFYLISGLVLVFITIAIPVQLNGNWVTLLWAGEAALLFWIGRTKIIPMYEKLAYPLIILAFFSLIHDWNEVHFEYFQHRFTPLLNINFLTSLLFLSAFGLIIWLQHRKPTVLKGPGWDDWFSLLIPAIFVFVLYTSFFLEIDQYWGQAYHDSAISEGTYPLYNRNLLDLKGIWLVNYTLIFFTLLSLVNIRKLKNRRLAHVNLILNGLALFLFLAGGLYILSELRGNYLHRATNEYYQIGKINIGVRYISLALFAGLLFVSYRYTQQKFMTLKLDILFEIIVHGSLLWVISSELLHWMDLLDSNQSYKLGLSILWGTYALILIVLGIWKKRQYLRIMAMILFAITLIKLFFYDIASLGTLSKTIVFVALGVLLLIISFLYNKYKNQISDETENNTK